MKKLVIFLVFVGATVRIGFSQINDLNQAQSLYIYNFSRLIQWPESSKTGDFIIGILGDNELYNTLLNFSVNKKVGAQQIVIKKFDEPQNVSGCHIVFVGNGKIGRMSEVVERLRGSYSLIITERKGMVNSGSAIDFFVDQDKLRFVVNSENAERYNLTVSKSLEDMSYRN